MSSSTSINAFEKFVDLWTDMLHVVVLPSSDLHLNCFNEGCRWKRLPHQLDEGLDVGAVCVSHLHPSPWVRIEQGVREWSLQPDVVLVEQGEGYQASLVLP